MARKRFPMFLGFVAGGLSGKGVVAWPGKMCGRKINAQFYQSSRAEISNLGLLSMGNQSMAGVGGRIYCREFFSSMTESKSFFSFMNDRSRWPYFLFKGKVRR